MPAFLAIVIVLVAFAGVACESSSATAPIQIRQPLPDEESLAYNLVDSSHARIGSAMLAIQRNGDSLVLSQSYSDLNNHTDNGSVTVDRSLLTPQKANREIHTASVNSRVDVTYTANAVSTVANDGSEHRNQANITPATYDDQEDVFLMRTLEFTQGTTAHFNLVVVDASKGTISRAAAGVRVNGTQTITLGGKSIKAWQIELTGAGATSTAWYDTTAQRRLLRYDNPRGTSIELANP